MKSERRHELQHNQLADALGQWSQKLKPYARLIGGVMVLLFVLSVAYAYVSGKSQQQSAAGWDEYFEAIDLNDRNRLTEIAEKYPGTNVAQWSRVVAADMALSDGCQNLLSNKKDARDLLKQAVNNYQTVIKETTDATLKQRALFGVGRAHESLASLEDLKKARDDYRQLLDGWPDGVYSEAAKQRLKDLERNSTKEFYDWFADYEPPSKTTTTGKKPEFIEDSLKGDITLPSALDDLKLDGPDIKIGEPAPDSGTAEEPPSEKPSDEKPADAPAESPPAESPPADEPASTSPEPSAEPPGDQAEK